MRAYLATTEATTTRQNRNLSLSSTRINDLHSGNNVQSQAGKQREADPSHIYDPAGLRIVIDDRYANERQGTTNRQNLVNHNSINEHHISINGYSNRQTPHKMSNGVAKSQVNISSGLQCELTNGSATSGAEKTPDRPKQNGHPATKNHRSNVDHKNGINRLSDASEKPAEQKQLQKEDTYNIAANLRQLLRPTVIEKRQEISKVEYDAEDINGPYNFRQLLRPTGYLPTESLRKRKGGGLVSNRVPLPKDKVPEKHVKRRAPLAPAQNKLVNGKK